MKKSGCLSLRTAGDIQNSNHPTVQGNACFFSWHSKSYWKKNSDNRHLRLGLVFCIRIIFGVQKWFSSTSICKSWSHDKFQKGNAELLKSTRMHQSCSLSLAFSLKEYLEILNIKFHHSIFGVHRSVFVNHGAMTSYQKH